MARRRKTVFVRSVWVMLAIFFILLFAFVAVGKSIAMDNSAVINGLLDTDLTEKVQMGDGNEDMEYFKSDFPKKSADGSIEYVTEDKYRHQVYDHKAMRANTELVAEQTGVEGSVLLWNNELAGGKKALPLAKDAGVSLYGLGAYNYVLLGNGSGGMSLDPKKGSLPLALRDKGIAANSALTSKYLSLLNKYGRKWGNYGKDKNYLPWFTVNEAPWSEVAAVTDESIASYNDAAVMVISRTAGEDYDISTAAPPTGAKDNKGNPIDKEVYVDGSDNHLELTREEGEILRNLNALKTAGRLKSVVLLLNTANPMQFANIVKDEYGVDACVWVGMGGTMSFVQVADVLAGHDEFAVSGRAADTLVYDSYSAPSYANFGDFTWTEMSDKLPDLDKEYGTYYQTHNMKYMVYQEGIYVGYRYYETRYEDYVLGQGNAGAYDYSQTVAFPFGYGGSFTDFGYSGFNVTEKENAYEVSLNIKNIGTEHAGKDVLQVYLQKPYTPYDDANKIEKAAVELVGFAKTGLLKPGADETLTVTVDKENLRTYDAYGKGTYILEKGEYYLSVGTDAHDALNNILAAKPLTADQRARMTAAGDAAFTHKITVGADDYKKYSVSAETKNAITNRFDDADLNRYAGTQDQKIEYVSRKDWTGTLPAAAVTLKCVNDKMVEDMQYGTDDVVAAKEGDKTPLYGTVTAPEGELNIAMMVDLEYDHPLWQHLLNQMTLTEQQWLGSYGLLKMAGAKSVGAPGSKAADGPGGVKKNNPTAGQQFGFPSPVVMAQTWDTPLIGKLGVAFAHEALHLGIHTLYAPGANIHRSPFSGRNWEYYSEDGVLSGEMLCAEIKGMQSKGIMVMTKHFAFNDQERNRYGVATFFTEQSAREIYLKPFEIAVRKGKMNGIMSSFNRVGLTWAGAHRGLLTDVLRGEWDFIGIVETDSCTGNTFHMGTKYAKAEGLLAGNDMWMANGSETYFDEWKDNPTVMLALRQACHRILYTQMRSAAMNGVSTSTRFIPITPWWQAALNGAMIAVGIIALACVTMAALSFVFASARYKKFAAARKTAPSAAKAGAAHGVTAGVTPARSNGPGKTSAGGGTRPAGGSGGGKGGNKRPPLLTPKRKKILIIVVTSVVAAAIVLTSVLVPVLNCNNGGKDHVCGSVCEICGKCLDPDCDDPACAEKCEGHEPAVPVHVCESKCPVCEKCLDLTCTETVCAEKCNAGRTPYVFEAEDSVIEDGTASFAKYNIRTYHAGKADERTYVADLNQNYGAKLTFTVVADEDSRASLGITITRRNVDTVFTDKFGVSVNKGRELVRPVTIPAYLEKDQWADSSFADFNLGCIDLQKGTNTIVFTVQTPGNLSGYNFDKITLYGEKPLRAPAAPHACESECSVCGKCMDAACGEAVCAEKCEGHDLAAQEILATGAKAGKGTKGLPTPESSPAGLMGNMSENKGASLTFTFVAQTAGQARLIAAVTTRDKDIKFTDAMSVSVNGGGPLASEAVVRTVGGKNLWFESTEVELGAITLTAGVNTLAFTVLTDSKELLFNFHYVKLVRDDITPPVHICTSVCPECGKCLDAACTETACADKCGDGLPATVFEAEDAVTADGDNPYYPIKTYSTGRRTYVANMNGNTGATMTFEINTSAATRATLVVTANRRDIETIFTELIGVSVNGGPKLDRSVTVPAYGDKVQWLDESYTDINLGCINLEAGKNTVVFTVLADDPKYSGYNFDKITLLGNNVVAPPHVCASVCPVCGKCLDMLCDNAACAEKCGEGQPVTVFEAEDAAKTDGTAKWGKLKTVTDENGRVYMSNLNGNTGATLTFTVNTDAAVSVSLTVTINMRKEETVLTDVLGVSVNGGEKLVRPVKVPAHENQWTDAAFAEFNLGHIELAAGENTIVFTVLTTGEYSGYNFDKLSIYGEHIV